MAKIAAGKNTSFFEFLAIALPVALGFIVSNQVIALVLSFQEAFINPLLGYLLGSVALNDYHYDITDKITLPYGKFLATSVTFTVTMFLTYVLASRVFMVSK